MASISPKLPLYRDRIDGYVSNQTLIESTKQNFKCLVLTSPGERMMDPDFGVGIRKFLFEPATSDLKNKITKRVMDQTRKYLPFIKVVGIIVRSGEDVPNQSSNTANTLSVKIVYNIIPLHIQDTLELGIN